MGNFTEDKERIDRLCRLSGVNNSPKTLENIRRFLETYQSIRKDLEFLPKGLYSQEMWNEAPEIFKAMSLENPIEIEKIEAFLIIMLRSGQFEIVLDAAMNSMRAFSDDGEKYSTIIEMLYLDVKPHKNVEIQDVIGYSHTAYQEKKDMATMLFGLMFWKQILDHWENATEEMSTIEKNLGRDGGLSTRKKNEENLKDNS